MTGWKTDDKRSRRKVKDFSHRGLGAAWPQPKRIMNVELTNFEFRRVEAGLRPAFYSDILLRVFGHESSWRSIAATKELQPRITRISWI